MVKISFKNFLKLPDLRKKHIDDADELPKDYKFAGNELAKINHPQVQNVYIKNIEDVTDSMKRYTLAPDKDKGTASLAPFLPGQYISVHYQIGEFYTNRPYSLCSGSDKYQIAIKSVKNGLTSNYALNNWKVGTKLEISAPEGWFNYQPLRDFKNIVALAGGSGITPFLSLAKYLDEKKIDINLILIYGARTIKDLSFKEEFDSIALKNDNFKVKYVLSDEEIDDYDYGFITKEIIKKYVSDLEHTSFFVCGPKVMYQATLKELRNLNINRKNIRLELQGEAHNINEFDDKPYLNKKFVNITLKVEDKTYVIHADTSKTILRNIEENNIKPLSKCRSGVCGFCHSSLIKGKVFIPKSMDYLREGDKLYNKIHLCSAFALTDLVLEIAKA